MSAIIKAIQKHGKQVIGAKWCDKEEYLKPFYEREIPTSFGIYFIVNGFDILKIGKASGKKGLQQRVTDYISKTYYHSKDRQARDKTAQKVLKAFRNELHDSQIDIYVIDLNEYAPDIEDKILGGIIKVDPVRAYEIKFTQLAKEEEHTLQLMTQVK